MVPGMRKCRITRHSGCFLTVVVMTSCHVLFLFFYYCQDEDIGPSLVLAWLSLLSRLPFFGQWFISSASTCTARLSVRPATVPIARSCGRHEVFAIVVLVVPSLLRLAVDGPPLVVAAGAGERQSHLRDGIMPERGRVVLHRDALG